MRELLAEIASIVESGGWQSPGPPQRRLRERVLELEAFDETLHRPKGVGMLLAMRGRSVAADGQLATLARDRGDNDSVLAKVKAALDGMARGEQGDHADLPARLTGYREGLLAQMHREETLLRSHAEHLLSEEEWSQVISEISTKVGRMR